MIEMTNEEYHAHHAISSSDVKMVHGKSLAHWQGAERKEKAAWDLGTSVHAMLLEPEKNLVRCGPETRRGNDWKVMQELAKADGAVLLPAADYELAHRMAASVRANAMAARLLSDPDLITEASFFCTDPAFELELKCRPDGFIPSKGIVFDVKTCQDASPRGFARAVRQFGYDVQAAFYLDVLAMCEQPAEKFIFICVEKDAPHCVGIHELTPEYLIWAERQVLGTLGMMAIAAEDGQHDTGWPTVNVIDLPLWLDEASDDF
jgi:hypothetical protein